MVLGFWVWSWRWMFWLGVFVLSGGGRLWWGRWWWRSCFWRRCVGGLSWGVIVWLGGRRGRSMVLGWWLGVWGGKLRWGGGILFCGGWNGWLGWWCGLLLGGWGWWGGGIGRWWCILLCGLVWWRFRCRGLLVGEGWGRYDGWE